MVLGHGHRRHSAASSRSSVDDRGDASATTAEDETVVDPEQGNMLMHIISQLRPGADLSRVTLPTFILEPRSMLERITNFMAHPEIMLPMTKIEDPVERFISVVKFYLSGWHIKPPGVKKPLNPILGETYTCYWDYPDKTQGYYIAEQTSHHPPKSSYFFLVPEHHIRIDGTLKPRSKFLGNSAASLMEGIAVMRFLNTGERFFVTQPNMYARGILFGKMKYELGDHSFVRCPESGLMADLEFKTKGYFGGTYNAIGGFIKDTNMDKNLYELSGFWNGEMFIKDLTTGKKSLLFDASKSRETPPTVRPMEEQNERESQKLWSKVVAALNSKDQEVATEEKTRIEDMQREEARRREDEGVDWLPQLFRAIGGGDEADLDWIINAKVDGKTPEELKKQVLSIAAILPGHAPQRRFSIPSRSASSYRVPTQKPASTIEDREKTAPLPPQQQQKQQRPEDDLIDFGWNDGANDAKPQPSKPVQVQPVQQPQPDQQAYSQIKQYPAGVPKYASAGHQTGTPPALKRHDSETNDVDEFVDAES